MENAPEPLDSKPLEMSFESYRKAKLSHLTSKEQHQAREGFLVGATISFRKIWHVLKMARQNRHPDVMSLQNEMEAFVRATNAAYDSRWRPHPKQIRALLRDITDTRPAAELALWYADELSRCMSMFTNHDLLSARGPQFSELRLRLSCVRDDLDRILADRRAPITATDIQRSTAEYSAHAISSLQRDPRPFFNIPFLSDLLERLASVFEDEDGTNDELRDAAGEAVDFHRRIHPKPNREPVTSSPELDDCPDCAGTGGYPDEPDCPRCKGSGRIQPLTITAVEDTEADG